VGELSRYRTQTRNWIESGEKVITGNVDACAVHEESTVLVPETGEKIPNAMQPKVNSPTSNGRGSRQ
jgi:hypothetical protein